MARVFGFVVPSVALFICLEMIGNTIMEKTKMKNQYLIGQNPAAYEIDITYFLLRISLMVPSVGALSVHRILRL